MQIVFNPARIGKTAMAIGNFDGVHLGHQAIINKAKEIAVEHEIKASVMTFEPHPRMFFQKDKAQKRISTFKRKMKLLEAAGVEVCYVMKFNYAFSRLTADDFMARFLRRAYVVTGQNFHFGADRGGDAVMLAEQLGERYAALPPVVYEGEVVSSSRVRTALQRGDLQLANALLGHNFSVSGKVRYGAQKGRELGFPTANLALSPKQLRPKYGVYAVKTNYGSGVANFGVRPTLDGKTELLEVHIFNFSGDIYGQDLQLELLHYIREEKLFHGIEELRKQITMDVENAKKILL